MRILVVGAGATGGYFGGRLADAGRDVTFLVRAQRAHQLRSAGLRIRSPHGDLHLAPRIVTAGELRPAFDLIILAVKAFVLEATLDDIANAVTSEVMLLPFLNGMRHLNVLIARFGSRVVLGGVCRVSTMTADDGAIVQLNAMQQIAYGERDGSASGRIATLDAVMQGAGFDARASTRIILEMWQKWIMLATLGAMTCLLRANVGAIEAVHGGVEIAARILAECVAVAKAAGVAPDAAFIDQTRELLTSPGSALTSSMYRDMQSGQPVEVEHILGDLIARARAAALDTPLLDAACASLRIYAATRAPALRAARPNA